MKQPRIDTGIRLETKGSHETNPFTKESQRGEWVMGKAAATKKMVRRVNKIYTDKGYDPRRYTEIGLMVKMAKTLEVPPDRFYDFVGWLAEGKSFQEARDNVVN